MKIILGMILGALMTITGYTIIPSFIPETPTNELIEYEWLIITTGITNFCNEETGTIFLVLHNQTEMGREFRCGKWGEEGEKFPMWQVQGGQWLSTPKP